MKIGYGYNRPEAALTDLGAERLYIDTHKTERAERAKLFDDVNLRPGDTLVMVALGDLGHGKQIGQLQKQLEGRNIKVEVPDRPTKYAKPGRPRKFVPNKTQDRQIERLYRDYFTLAHVLNRASEIMGYEVKRHQLIYRYGNRWQTEEPK